MKMDQISGKGLRRKNRTSIALRSEDLEHRALLTDPTFTSMEDWSAPENDVNVATASATDADNDPLTFSIAGTGADDALFTVDATTGDVTFLAPPDFETRLDANADNIYDVDIQVDDGNSGPVVQTMHITVTDIDDETPVFTTSENLDRVEGTTTLVAFIVATDKDASSVLSYSLTGNGTDDALFDISTTDGRLDFKTAPSFANPIDANQDNVYDIEV